MDVPRPIVVELFTSQGCSSCPPAEKMLAEIADRKDVLALAFHVDYWDRLGWKDPFASPVHTERQRFYMPPLERSGLFTPQFVIDGAVEFSGARKFKLYDAIKRMSENMPAVPIRLVASSPNQLTLHIGNSELSENSVLHDIWLASFDHSHTTLVESGENRGRFLVNRNTVREFLHLGNWQGSEKTLFIPLDKLTEADALAVLVQEPQTGRIVGSFRHDRIKYIPPSHL